MNKMWRKNPLVLMVLFFFFRIDHIGAAATCSSDHIRCKAVNKCIKISYICDGDNDCGDRTDESFCDAWRDRQCSRGQAYCSRSDGYNSCMEIKDYCTSYPSCTGTVDPRICKMMIDGEIQQLWQVVIPTEPPIAEETTVTLPSFAEETELMRSETMGKLFADTFYETLKHAECPLLFTKVGEQCLSFPYFLKLNWGEAEQFCQVLNGTLASYADDHEGFITLQKHLSEIKMTSDFWIGGRRPNDTDTWEWLSGDDMEMGSPFWAVRYDSSCTSRSEDIDGSSSSTYWANSTACYHYTQAPHPNESHLCAAMTFQYFYYMTDEDCMTKRSPLCMAIENKRGSHDLTPKPLDGA